MNEKQTLAARPESGDQIAAEAELQLSFRDAMAQVAGPVTVITGEEGGVAHGTTVSAFMSLSVSPSMVLVSLNVTSALLDIVSRTGAFGVNILAKEQQAVATSFARKGADKFAGIDWRMDHGLPRIHGVAAWLACDVEHILEGGDHMILIGRVQDVTSAESDPLTYHNRVFGTHTPLSTE